MAAFVGPSNRERSAPIDAEASVNVFVSTVASAGNAKHATLMGTPGLKPFLTITPEVVCRGMFAEDGRTFAVVGTHLYELNLSGLTVTDRGTVANDGKMVFFASNGRGGEQLAIVSAGILYIFRFTTNVLTIPVLPLTNPAAVVRFVDGFFLLLEANSIRVWYSAIFDGTLWNALDFFARSQSSDQLVGLDVLRTRIWCFGSHTTQIYYDSGDALNPFIPEAGSLMEEGLVAPTAQGQQGEAMIWVSQDTEGHGRIVRATTAQVERISTPAIDVALASYPTLSDCEILVYEQEGHPFACFTFPSGGFVSGEDGVTWGWDDREKSWHQRAGFDEGRGIQTRWRARGFCTVGQTVDDLLVGDYQTGRIASLDLNTFTDYGVTILRRRRAPYLSEENQWLFLDRFELGIEAGVGLLLGQGVDPQLLLRVSGDSGKTWGPGIAAPLGHLGVYLERAVWCRLGRHRADRLVVEVTQSDPVRCVWGPGAWLKARPGSGQL